MIDVIYLIGLKHHHGDSTIIVSPTYYRVSFSAGILAAMSPAVIDNLGIFVLL